MLLLHWPPVVFRFLNYRLVPAEGWRSNNDPPDTGYPTNNRKGNYKLTSGVSSTALAVAKPAAAKRRAETFMAGNDLKKWWLLQVEQKRRDGEDFAIAKKINCFIRLQTDGRT